MRKIYIRDITAILRKNELKMLLNDTLRDISINIESQYSLSHAEYKAFLAYVSIKKRKNYYRIYKSTLRKMR